MRVHAGKRTYMVREKISDFERSLPPGRFVRIHRSIIVNLDAVAECSKAVAAANTSSF